MDEVRNPFAPGAGSQPPQLAGRDGIIEEARIAVQRAVLGRPARSQILLGLRGVGKTVLLNKIEDEAQAAGHLTSMIEAPEGFSLAELLFPAVHQVLRKLSLSAQAKAATHSALRALRAFAGAFKLKLGEIGIAVDPEPGVADSGTLEFDLPDLFLRVGEAARAAGKGWTLLIDEVQYLSEAELAALIVAIHRANQKNLPILFFGAGLPQVAALSGDAKSYAERLFTYPAVGPLDEPAAWDAIRRPVQDEGEVIEDAALAEIYSRTRGYPYYLQEWGFQVWNLAPASPITFDHAVAAGKAALARLDEGFFRIRYDRLTPKEQDYIRAMARLGNGPYRSADVAAELGESLSALGPRRAAIIQKGMIYSPGHGEIAFTVPLFEDYLARHWL